MKFVISTEAGTCKPGLYIVATPIGNLRDVSIRALDVLAQADVILCEDTRVTSRLLQEYGISHKKMLQYTDHSEEKDRQKIENILNENKIVALVSDAGTPLISDPGYKLVQNYKGYLTIIPGANAAVSALAISGLPTDRFMFVGFPPPKSGSRQNWFKEISDIKCPLIIYESPNRICETIKDAATVFGNRKFCIVRELTKIFEEKISGNLAEFEDREFKGEIVLIIEGAVDEEYTDEQIVELIKRELSSGTSVKDAVENISSAYNLPKKKVYNLALICKN